MINLRTRTEYSLELAYGPIDKIISDCKQDSMGIYGDMELGVMFF